MSPKEECVFYENMARKYKAEEGQRTLSQFCREENLSYSRMIHILRTESYRKENAQSYDRKAQEPVIAPLEIGSPALESEFGKVAVGSSAFENVEIELGTAFVLRIGRCDGGSLGDLIARIRMQGC